MGPGPGGAGAMEVNLDLLALDSLTLNEEAWDSLWCTMMPDIVYAPR